MSGVEAPAGRIWLVDDDPGFRESVGWWLEGLGHEVTAFEAPQACIDAVAQAAGEGPACFLLDVRMPQMSGLQLLDALRAAGATWPVVFMTGHGDVPLAVEAMRKGALTFLEKPFKEAALEEALAQAFSAAAQAGAVDAAPAGEGVDPELQARLERLTPREREIMDLLVEGRQNKEVAGVLDISPKTVELHRSRVMAKMEAGSLTQLVRMMVSGRLDG